MLIAAPRMPRISRSLLAQRSTPSKRIAPLVVAASTRRSTDNALIDLPEPDSPTSANFSPGAIANDTSSTTFESPKLTLRRSTDSRGWRSSRAS